MRNICNSYVILVGVFFDCLTQYYVLSSCGVNWHATLCSV